MSASSHVMHEVFQLITRLAKTDVTVTLMGETGTGKDVLAHALHADSPRASGPLVIFDCGAVPPNLVESELFGHERGSFTGAHSEHAGAFERAQGGTLFLDEVGELPLDLQPKLLRMLESRRVRRVGGTKDRAVDVRMVAATNRDLAALVTGRTFREDLYFRLAAAVVSVPPLRERTEDLPILVRDLLEDLRRPAVRIAPEAMAMLDGYHWPGNVRELKNTLACALAFVENDLIEPRHLRFLPPSDDGEALARLPLAGRSLDSLERAAIKQTLIHTGGSKARAAESLGIAVSTLYEKLKKYKIG